MNRKTICIIICLLNLPAAAIDYNDFPPTLQQVLDERTAELASKGGMCIAGIVTMDDEIPVRSGKDVKINFNQGIDESLFVYDGGWFVMNRVLSSGNIRPGKNLVLRAFGYEPIDAAIAVRKGEVTYAEFVMKKTPVEKLASITGTILNDQNEPIEGAMVNISFPLAYRVTNEQPQMAMYTEPNGSYSFEGLTATEHHLWIPSLSGYAGIAFEVTPIAGKTTIANRKMYQNRSINIDYIYQADGSRSFAGGDLQKGTIEWINGHNGMDFSEGEIKGYNPQSMRDLELIQEQDKLSFLVTYDNGENGFYDAGDVDFESVTEAAETGYSTRPKPCVVGHTYIVTTFEKNYAKFVVRSISGGE